MTYLPPPHESLHALIAEPFNGPLPNFSSGRSDDGARLHALGGPAAVMAAAEKPQDTWDPTADEQPAGFDIHLGVYAID